MEKIKINVLDNSYEYDKGISLADIAKDFKDEYEYSILAGFVDNEFCELNYCLNRDCSIKFVTVSDSVGNTIYKKGLLFVLLYAFKLIYGSSSTLKACHSLGNGIRMRSNNALNEDDLNNIKSKMKELIEKDLNIEKVLVDKGSAIDYFINNGDLEKANTFKYLTNHYVNLYKIGDYYNYFFSYMPISTGVFTSFDLSLVDDNNFILGFPSVGDSALDVSYDLLLDTFNICYKRAKRLGIFTSSDINEIVANGKIGDIIKITEVISSNDLLNIAKSIYDFGDKIRVVLLSGPSSSGKTTTARKLSMFLKSFGYNPVALSIDDYFVEREDTPRLPNGDYDFESIRAIDVDLFNDNLNRLLSGEEVKIPTFNFKNGVKEYLGNTLKLGDKDILIIEGLHALNDELTYDIDKDKKYKIYVSPLTDLNIDNYNMVSNSDLRLIRRILRDNRTRGYSAEHTISTWQNVRDGERKYIYPNHSNADVVYNTSLIYEIGVLKLYVLPLLYEIDSKSPSYYEAVRLINFLGMFSAISSEEIPSESILREFIGNSYFE